MKSARIVLLAAFALLYMVHIAEAQHKRARDDYGYLKPMPKYSDEPNVAVTRTDFTVTLRDGTILDALKFIPQGTPPAGGWPT